MNSPYEIDYTARNRKCTNALLASLILHHGEPIPEPESIPIPEPIPPPVIFTGNKIDQIKRMVCKHFGVSRESLESNSRKRTVVRPRQIGMYLSRRYTTYSFPQIGQRFGGRDHTTILHAFHKVRELIEKDAKLAADVANLEAMI